MNTRGEFPSMMKRQGARESNEHDVILSFADSDEVPVIAVYDTGTDDNWMSDSFCRTLGLQRFDVREESYKDFQNRSFKSHISVRGYWHYGRQTREVDFRIIPDPPFVVLFGNKTLLKFGIVSIARPDEEYRKPALVLAKDRQNPSKSKSCSANWSLKFDNCNVEECKVNDDHARAEQEKASKAELARTLQEAGWTWDPVQKQYWKNTTSGTKQWYEGKS
jgi:hypothetical protein